MITVYTSSTCPKCEILKKKMDLKGIEYKEVMDNQIPESKGITFVPILEIDDGTLLNFSDANRWVNER